MPFWPANPWLRNDTRNDGGRFLQHFAWSGDLQNLRILCDLIGTHTYRIERNLAAFQTGEGFGKLLRPVIGSVRNQDDAGERNGAEFLMQEFGHRFDSRALAAESQVFELVGCARPPCRTGRSGL